jgi:hypothetical protein
MNIIDLFEDINTRRIVATTRFFKEYPKFVKKYSAFNANLRDFLLFRQSAPREQLYNSKDGMMTGPNWKGIPTRRCHIVHGKAIVLYQLTDAVKLLIIGEHDDLEGGSTISSLQRYIATLSPNDYDDFPIPNTDAPKKKLDVEPLDADQEKEIKSLFLMLVGHPTDRAVIERLAKNDIAGFMDWARLTLGVDDDSQDKAIIKSLGGRDIMMKRAKLWLEKTAQAVQEAAQHDFASLFPIELCISPQQRRGASHQGNKSDQ